MSTQYSQAFHCQAKNWHQTKLQVNCKKLAPFTMSMQNVPQDSLRKGTQYRIISIEVKKKHKEKKTKPLYSFKPQGRSYYCFRRRKRLKY